MLKLPSPHQGVLLNEGNAEADGYPEDEEIINECFEVDSSEVEVNSEVGGP